MITADQIVAHLVGDYVLQSDWMAQKKRAESGAAAAHAAVYTLCFLPFAPSVAAVLVIYWSHFLIDRLGLARYVVWLKNWLAPRWIALETREPGGRKGTAHVRNLPWAKCQSTGYPWSAPPFLAVWLTIIADNTLHLLINGMALAWL
jgi:hypothetical protein